MKVEDLLKKKSGGVITVHPEQTIHEASKTLVEKRIGVLVVVDSSDTPIGIISERDIVRELAANLDGIRSRTVGDVMTKDLIIALPEDELNYVSNTMTNKRIRHLPVMQGNTLVGLVSIGDVVKAQLDYFEGEAHTLRQYITGGYA